MSEPVTLFSVGDIILDEPQPDSFFQPSAPLLSTGDVVIGHVEVPHSTVTTSQSTDVPAPPADPAALKALPVAGFHVATLAGNHVFDAGEDGIADTVRHCRDAGLLTTGAGANLTQARAAAIIEAGGLRFGVLSYNCVGPRESWATSGKAGCAYVKVLTHYELDHASPGGPPKIYTFADPDSLDAMAADIEALRAEVDVVAVSMHKGVGHTPVAVAMYERPVARAAIDAGADAVFGHHAHIMRGLEVYRGRPIFHGLGNFVTVTHALTPSAGQGAAELQEWARRRTKLYGFAPDPAMPFYPFHPESRNSAIGVCRFGPSGIVQAGVIPCWIDDLGRPVPLGPGPDGDRVLSYIQRITDEAHLGATLRWDGDVAMLEGIG